VKNGFTLIELMIVLAIIAILAAIAYPSYQDHIQRTRRADAMGTLLGMAGAMERYYTERNSYVGTAAGTAPSPPAATLYPSQAPLDGSTKYYNLTIETATANAFTLRATPIGAQAGDGYIELTSINARRWDRNDNGAVTADELCWERSC